MLGTPGTFRCFRDYAEEAVTLLSESFGKVARFSVATVATGLEQVLDIAEGTPERALETLVQLQYPGGDGAYTLRISIDIAVSVLVWVALAPEGGRYLYT